MRIFLVQPPTGFTEGGLLLEPLGLAYIGAVCQEAGHKVELHDLLNVRLADPTELFRRMDAFRPELIGITSLTANYEYGLMIARAVKARYGCPVVFGGWHVSGEPQSVLDPAIDYVVCGEGEETILELLDHLEGKGPALCEIESLAYVENSALRVNKKRMRIKKLTSLPRPLRDQLPIEHYKFPPMFVHPYSRLRTLSVQASRGCPYTCSFCQTPVLWGNTWSKRTPVTVVDEIEELVDRYGANSLWVRDEEFTIRPRWVMEICEEMIRRRLPKRLRWGSFCRPDDITPELMATMKEAGYAYGILGLEAGAPDLREKMQKFYKQEEAERALELFDQYDVTSQGGWIIGSPWDTRETIERSFRWLLTLKLDFLYLAFATPFGGTPLRREVEERGLFPPDTPTSAFTCKRPLLEPPGISIQELEILYRQLVRRFYLRPRYLLRLARRIAKQPRRAWILAEFATWTLRDGTALRRLLGRGPPRNRGFEIPRGFREPALLPSAMEPAT